MTARRKPKTKRAKAKRPRLSNQEKDALRYAARCAYTLDHQPVSLETLASRPVFAPLGLAKLAAWAKQEDWAAERRANVERWRRRAEARLNASLQRRTLQQRAVLQNLHDQAVALRCQQVVQPKSWEQVAGVQLKTASMLRQWHREDVEAAARLASGSQQRVAETPQQRGRGLPVELLSGSDEEFQDSAHAMLERRLSARMEEEGATPADGTGGGTLSPSNSPNSDEVEHLHADSA